MAKLMIATGNEYVFNALRDLIDGDDIEILSHSDASVELPIESGTTFDQNAMEIADKGAQASDLVTISEVSGIEVDVLDGAPGVSSARYAGPHATDGENRAALLRELDDSGYQSRSARMISFIGVAHPDGRLQSFGSSLEGTIANEERGIEGDAYEPIFELEDGMTIAELLPEARGRVHPRSVAYAKAKPFINELLAEQGS